jgi:hypothetical protein
MTSASIPSIRRPATSLQRTAKQCCGWKLQDSSQQLPEAEASGTQFPSSHSQGDKDTRHVIMELGIRAQKLHDSGHIEETFLQYTHFFRIPIAWKEICKAKCINEWYPCIELCPTPLHGLLGPIPLRLQLASTRSAWISNISFSLTAGVWHKTNERIATCT